MDESSPQLYREIPQIRRARDFRLYDEAGKRYLDFYQDAGHAVLGHRPLNLEKTLKNTIDRGLYASMPSAHTGRLFKALAVLFPDMKSFGLYGSRERALAVLAALGTGSLEDPVAGSAAGRQESGPAGKSRPAALWRPFSGLDYSAYPALIPLLPLPGSRNLGLVCFREPVRLPDSDPVSAVVCAGLSRIVWNLVWAHEHGRFPGHTSGQLPAFRLWDRKGIYLIPSYPEHAHPDVFRSFLSKGFLLSPSFTTPSILPGEWSEGERTAFFRTETMVAGRRNDGTE